MYNILVCDDEKDIVSALTIYLQAEGYHVFDAENGLQALEILRREQVHLVLLDIMMPGLDGLHTMQRLREFSNVPVILLTAKSEDNDKILGLTAGADDYVTKPFNPIEVMARVKSQLRRFLQLGGGTVRSNVLHIGGIELDDDAKTVKLDGELVNLTPKEYELMVYFKNNRGIALSREKILNAVWGYDYFGDLRTVDTHIKKLRAKLGEYGAKIETVRGYGYRFEV